MRFRGQIHASRSCTAEEEVRRLWWPAQFHLRRNRLRTIWLHSQMLPRDESFASTIFITDAGTSRVLQFIKALRLQSITIMGGMAPTEHAVALPTHPCMQDAPAKMAPRTMYRYQPHLVTKRPSPGWQMWKRSSNACHLSRSLSLGRYQNAVRVCSFIDKCRIHQLRSSIASMPIVASLYDVPALLRNYRWAISQPL